MNTQELEAYAARLEHSLRCILERADTWKGKGGRTRRPHSATDACAWISGEAIGVLATKPKQ